jgi:hypothetical protein
MKKIYTIFSLTLTFIASAQSFSLYKTANGNNTHTLTNGVIVDEVTSINNITETKIKIINNAASTVTLNVIRTILSSSPAFINDNSSSTPNTYFCFGKNCFGSSTSTADPDNYTVLLASGQSSATSPPMSDNSSTSNQPFNIYLEEGVVMGDYAVRYKVFNIVNANDTIEFNIKYNNGQVGITEISKAEASLKAFPNPAGSFVNLSVENSNEEVVSVLVYNALGAVVKSISMPKNTSHAVQIPTSDLANGLYEFVVRTKQSVQQTKVLIAN